MSCHRTVAFHCPGSVVAPSEILLTSYECLQMKMLEHLNRAYDLGSELNSIGLADYLLWYFGLHISDQYKVKLPFCFGNGTFCYTLPETSQQILNSSDYLDPYKQIPERMNLANCVVFKVFSLFCI